MCLYIAGPLFGPLGCAAGLPAPNVERVATCAARYQLCVATANTWPEYKTCRAGVDADCLDPSDAAKLRPAK